jgi:uncharacterized protein YqjF (DUF2071 family)
VRGKPSAKPALRMQWKQLLFLHWSWDAREIQGTLPDGLFVDTFDGKAWLAIVPFFMRRVHPMGLPCLPWLSNFVELARRFFHLNYVHARIEARIDTHNVCSYKARRHGIAEASFRYGPSGAKAPARPGSLEFFLVERYVLFSGGRIRQLSAGRVHHVPYRIGPAALEKWSFIPAMADGFKRPAGPADHVMVAEDIEVRAWAIQAHPAVP